MRRTLAITGLLLFLVSARAASAQALGQLAQQESARRKAISSPARVITNDDLTAAPVLGTLTSAASTPAGAVPVSPVPRRVAVTPATLQTGTIPRIPVESVSGGEVVLEVAVDKTGQVTAVTALRDTPPFTDEVVAAVREWRFQPAEDANAAAPGEAVDLTTRQPVDSSVLVVGLFRPPSLYPVTLGQPPKDVAAPSETVPALLSPLTMPLYPPQALFDGVVLTELSVGIDGKVLDAKVLRSAPGLDEPTLDAVRRLTFRPARVHGSPAPMMVYVVTAFRQPIIQ